MAHLMVFMPGWRCRVGVQGWPNNKVKTPPGFVACVQIISDSESLHDKGREVGRYQEPSAIMKVEFDETYCQIR